MTLKDRFVETIADYRGVDREGKEYKLKNVPALEDTRTHETIFDLKTLMREEQKHYAEQLGIDPLAVFPMLFMIANEDNEPMDIYTSFKFHKMLFTLMSETIKNDMLEATVQDEIIDSRDGPITKNLKPITNELEKQGLVKIKKGGKRPYDPWKWGLTKKGEEIALNLWNKMDASIVLLIEEIFDDIYPKKHREIHQEIHKRFPQYTNLMDKRGVVHLRDPSKYPL